MLTDEERKDLVRYRIEKAYRVLGEARDNAQLGHWNLTGNRLYCSQNGCIPVFASKSLRVDY